MSLGEEGRARHVDVRILWSDNLVAGQFHVVVSRRRSWRLPRGTVLFPGRTITNAVFLLVSKVTESIIVTRLVFPP